MYDCRESSNTNADPPDEVIISELIIKISSEPNSEESSELMGKEYHPVKRAHELQTIDVTDQSVDFDPHRPYRCGWGCSVMVGGRSVDS